jgi:glycogen synthase
LTPEYGKFIKTGGLAVIIEDLCDEISRLGTHFTIIIPYFNENQKKETDYLK